MHRPAALPLTALLAVFACHGVTASPSDVDEVIVVATRTEAPMIQVPYSAHVINSGALFDQGYRSLPQALRDIPGIMVQETAPGQGSPFIRGFTGFRSLLLIDGVRLNNSVFRDGPNQYWSTVDHFGLSHIEVVNGPAGALYGTDAIGGVVNVNSRTPGETGAEVELRASSAERSQQLRVQADQRIDENLGMGIGLSAKEFGDLDSGGDIGRQHHVGYTELGADLRVIKHLDADTTIQLMLQYLRQDDVPRHHSTIHAKSWRGTTVGTDLRRNLDQLRHLGYVKYTSVADATLWDRQEITLSWHRTKETEDRLDRLLRARLQGFEVDTLGVTSQLNKLTALGDLAYGFEIYHDLVDSFSISNPIQGPVADDATYTGIDLFLQDTVRPMPDLTIMGGLRYSQQAMDADSVRDPVSGGTIEIERDWDTFAANGRLHYVLTDSTMLFGGVSEGFRAPNLSDLTRLDSARSNEFEVAAPDLEPERFLAFEAGFKFRNDRAYAQVSFFHTDIRNMIIRTPTGILVNDEFEVTKQNAGDGHVRGLELSGSYAVHDQVEVSGTFTWQDGEVAAYPSAAPTLVAEPVSRLMPTRIQVRARWTRPDQGLWAEFSVIHAQQQDRLSSSDVLDTQRIPPGGTPGYTVADAAVGYRITNDFKLALRIDNLTNRAFRVHGSGNNMPGRNAILEVALSFR